MIGLGTDKNRKFSADEENSKSCSKSLMKNFGIYGVIFSKNCKKNSKLSKKFETKIGLMYAVTVQKLLKL